MTRAKQPTARGPADRQDTGVRTSLTCADCAVRRSAEWQYLSDEEMSAIDRAKSSFHYPQGTPLVRPGKAPEGLYCLASGSVAEYAQDQYGNAVLVNMSLGSGLVGLAAYLRGGANTAGATTLGPSTVCTIPETAVSRAIATNQRLMAALVDNMTCELLLATEAEDERAEVPTIRQHLARFVLGLHRKMGSSSSSGSIEVTLPFTRSRIACLFGTTLDSVSAAFASMEADGVIEMAGRVVRIPKLRDLLGEASTAGLPASGLPPVFPA